MSWRVAKSLDVLLFQVNERWPNRDKSSDGTIGDASHSARTSDHNPNSKGVVCALDVTHDPSVGLDASLLAETLRQSHDPRIKYLISNARICSSTVKPWTWRQYSGMNAHRHHMHVSVYGNYDDTTPWAIVVGDAPKSSSGHRRLSSILATEFGGGAEAGMESAYGGTVDPDKPGVALPYYFKGRRNRVRVWYRGRYVDCTIVDQGPWNLNDPYWEHPDGRPAAERQHNEKTRDDFKRIPATPAGIDLTPAALDALGIKGPINTRSEIVDWEFI